MLEKGDIDVAATFSPATTRPSARTPTSPSPRLQEHGLLRLAQPEEPNLAKPEVREAFKYLVDYDAIGESLLKGIGVIHQNFLPAGILGSVDEKPYKLDIAKAKELLAKAGLADASP